MSRADAFARPSFSEHRPFKEANATAGLVGLSGVWVGRLVPGDMLIEAGEGTEALAASGTEDGVPQPPAASLTVTESRHGNSKVRFTSKYPQTPYRRGDSLGGSAFFVHGGAGWPAIADVTESPAIERNHPWA